MKHHIEEVQASLDAQTRMVTDIFSARPFEELLRRPSPKKWSVAEHVEHLSVTNDLYMKSIANAVASAKRKGWLAEGPFGGRWLAERLVASQEPPPRARFRAFRKTLPATDLDCPGVIERFRNVQDRTNSVLLDATGVDLGRAWLRSPLLPLLKLSAMQGFRLIESHNRRHIWHIEQCLGSNAYLRNEDGS